MNGPTCIYICAGEHSGSTLLDHLLGTHSQVSSLGEIEHLPKNIALNTRCTCGKPILDCGVWERVLANLSLQAGVDLRHEPYALPVGFPKAKVIVDRRRQTPLYLLRRRLALGALYLGLATGQRWLADAGGANRVLGNAFRLYDAVGRVLGSRFVVDSSKSYLRALGLYRLHPERVRVVLLSRDGRGVYYSQKKRGFPERERLRGWARHYRRALPLLDRYVAPPHRLRVAYEALAADPEAELRRLCDFVGIRFEPAMLDFGNKVHHSTNGNDTRFSGQTGIRPDTAWRTQLDAHDMALFERAAGSVNRALGYG